MMIFAATFVGDCVRQEAIKKMTVIQAVLQVVIDHVAQGERCIKNHLVESAHPAHQMSGRARLRELRLKGFLDYRVRDDNTYEILTSLEDLHRAWNRLTGVGAGNAPAVMRERPLVLSHLPAQAAIDAGTGGSGPAKEEKEEQVAPDDIRKFIESLG